MTTKPDPYASEEETKALLVPYICSAAEKRLHTMMDERGAWEQGVDSYPALYQIALELLTEQEREPAQIAGFDVVIDTSMPSNTMKFVQPEHAQQTFSGYERLNAIREGHRNVSEDRYFSARPEKDSDLNRTIFRHGFDRGYECIGHPSPTLESTTAAQPADQSRYCLNCEELSKELAALKKQPQIACCAECGKKDSDGWALYCVECMDKIHAILDSAEKKLDTLIAQNTPTPSPKNHGDI